jgi:hypothetical protein
MARHYDVAAVQLALGVGSKWLDNLLSHYSIPGVVGGRQGVARRITGEGLMHIALVATLARGHGLRLPEAVSLAGRLIAAPGGRLDLSGELRMTVDIEQLRRSLGEKLVESMEFAAPRRRGRPPRRLRAGEEDA